MNQMQGDELNRGDEEANVAVPLFSAAVDGSNKIRPRRTNHVDCAKVRDTSTLVTASTTSMGSSSLRRPQTGGSLPKPAAGAVQLQSGSRPQTSQIRSRLAPLLPTDNEQARAAANTQVRKCARAEGRLDQTCCSPPEPVWGRSPTPDDPAFVLPSPLEDRSNFGSFAHQFVQSDQDESDVGDENRSSGSKAPRCSSDDVMTGLERMNLHMSPRSVGTDMSPVPTKRRPRRTVSGILTDARTGALPPMSAFEDQIRRRDELMHSRGVVHHGSQPSLSSSAGGYQIFTTINQSNGADEIPGSMNQEFALDRRNIFASQSALIAPFSRETQDSWGTPHLGPAASQPGYQDSMSLPPRYIHYFRELQEIGRGHFGTVTLVEDRSTRALFAVKASSPFSNKREQQRWEHERRILHAIVGFPHVVSVVDSWREGGVLTSSGEGDNCFRGGRVYLQMPYMEKGSLFQALAQRRLRGEKWAEKELLIILGHMSLALCALHDAGIVHVDVKPENIFVDAEDRYYLGDFGCALTLDPVTQRPQSFRNNILHSSNLGGGGPHGAKGPSGPSGGGMSRLAADLKNHPGGEASALSQSVTSHDEGDCRYLSIDMLNSKSDYCAGDMFSLGMSLYELASGAELPRHGAAFERMRNRTELNELSKEGYSDALVQLILSLIAPEPSARPRAIDVLQHPLLQPSPASLTFVAQSQCRLAQLRSREADRKTAAEHESQTRLFVESSNGLPTDRGGSSSGPVVQTPNSLSMPCFDTPLGQYHGDLQLRPMTPDEMTLGYHMTCLEVAHTLLGLLSAVTHGHVRQLGASVPHNSG